MKWFNPAKLVTTQKPGGGSRLSKSKSLMAAALLLVGGYEGLRTTAYRDVVGIPTVCFGETRGVKMGDRYSVEDCKAMLGTALVEFETGMRACLINPNAVPDKPYVAMLSATYNIGVGSAKPPRGFCGSSMARLLNAGDIRGSCNALLAWNKAGGKIVAGLTRRRQEERALCLEGAG